MAAARGHLPFFLLASLILCGTGLRTESSRKRSSRRTKGRLHRRHRGLYEDDELEGAGPEKCLNKCSENGKCKLNKSKFVLYHDEPVYPHVCECDDGWVGVDCSIEVDQYLRYFLTKGEEEFPKCCPVCAKSYLPPDDYFPKILNPFSNDKCKILKSVFDDYVGDPSAQHIYGYTLDIPCDVMGSIFLEVAAIHSSSSGFNLHINGSLHPHPVPQKETEAPIHEKQNENTHNDSSFKQVDPGSESIHETVKQTFLELSQSHTGRRTSFTSDSKTQEHSNMHRLDNIKEWRPDADREIIEATKAAGNEGRLENVAGDLFERREPEGNHRKSFDGSEFLRKSIRDVALMRFKKKSEDLMKKEALRDRVERMAKEGSAVGKMALHLLESIRASKPPECCVMCGFDEMNRVNKTKEKMTEVYQDNGHLVRQQRMFRDRVLNERFRLQFDCCTICPAIPGVPKPEDAPDDHIRSYRESRKDDNYFLETEAHASSSSSRPQQRGYLRQKKQFPFPKSWRGKERLI
mmetsp:Transcript_10845/g.16159  ORF Transcript_10845/g.16159 Transcript_10845/m.16159 type:complete len:519 (+) Transcript_10845:2-1558(+)